MLLDGHGVTIKYSIQYFYLSRWVTGGSTSAFLFSSSSNLHKPVALKTGHPQPHLNTQRSQLLKLPLYCPSDGLQFMSKYQHSHPRRSRGS